MFTHDVLFLTDLSVLVHRTGNSTPVTTNVKYNAPVTPFWKSIKGAVCIGIGIVIGFILFAYLVEAACGCADHLIARVYCNPCHPLRSNRRCRRSREQKQQAMFGTSSHESGRRSFLSDRQASRVVFDDDLAAALAISAAELDGKQPLLPASRVEMPRRISPAYH
jgi:hypothetical protein